MRRQVPRRGYTRRKAFVVHGIEFQNLKEACTHFGLPYNCHHMRTLRDSSLSQAEKILSLIDHEQAKPRRFTFRGVGYKSLNDCCTKLGINPTQVYREINNGVGGETALERVIASSKKEMPKKPKSAAEIALSAYDQIIRSRNVQGC